MPKQSVGLAGFTLLELVIVVLLVSVLTLAVTPVFIDLTDEASAAATNSVALMLGSASVRNYAIRQEVYTRGSGVSNCTDVTALVSSWTALYAAEYTVAPAGLSPGATTLCSVANSSGQSAQFTGHGIG